MKKTLLFSVLISLNILISANISLNDIGLKYGTDKSSIGHDYLKNYEYYFNKLRDKSIKFLEIGFAGGASARTWNEYFREADLYFIDVNKSCYDFFDGLSEKCHLNLVDQADEKALTQFINKVGGNFDVIVDDGGHTMNQQITSFKVLFPHLNSGGIYVIEDLHTSYWSLYGGSGDHPTKNKLGYPKTNESSAINFFLNLVHEINFYGALTGFAGYKNSYVSYPGCFEDIQKQLNDYRKQIDSIHFYTSLCFIIKK